MRVHVSERFDRYRQWIALRPLALLWSGCLLISFCMIGIAGGHGFGLVGIFLLVGHDPDWDGMRLISIVGISAMIISGLLRKEGAYRLSTFSGITLLLIAWICVASLSDIFMFSL